MDELEDTPLRNESVGSSYICRARTHWHRLKSSTHLVILVTFVTYALENLLVTAPSTLYPVIVASVQVNMNPNCSQQSAETLLKGDLEDLCKFAYIDVTFLIGLLVAAKSGAQILLSIVAGMIIDRCGHKIPMVIGCIFNAIGCLGFAFANSVWLLFAARVLQGLASALCVMCASVLLAATFIDHDELTRSTGIAFVGFGLGAVLGWPFGAFSYELMGRTGPFIILAGLCFVDGILRLILSPTIETKHNAFNEKFCGWCNRHIISDPQVLISLFNIFYYCFFLSLFGTFQPPTVFDRLNGEIWQIGTIVLIALIFQVVLQVATGLVAFRIGLWKLTFVGFLCCGASYIIFTFLNYIWQVLGTELLNRVGHAFILSSCFVQYTISTEKRQMSYGSQMTLLCMSYNLGIMLGPLIGGLILDFIDYNWLFRSLGISIFLFALPTLIFRQDESYSRQSSFTEEGDEDEFASNNVSDYGGTRDDTNVSKTTNGDVTNSAPHK